MQNLLWMLIEQNINNLISTEAGGALFETALLQLLSDNKTDFTKLTGTLALYWQILDDYCDLSMQQVISELSD
jgi:hypothetical protein